MSGSVPDADTLLASLRAAETVAAHNTNQAVDHGPSGWEEPVPLGACRQLPVFPVDALPGWVAEEVAAVAEFTQTPPDLPGSIALAALSTAAGGRAIVEVRGSWREPVNIYTAVAMHAGSRKSAVFALMTAPLLDAERQLAEDGQAARVEADQARKLAEQQAQHAEATAAAAGPGRQDEALAEAIDAALHATTIEVPAIPRLVADDVTPEAAASLLAEQGGRLAILSAEGGVFATMAGRYTHGSANFEVLLKGHSGDLLRVDRKGRAAEHIGHPALTLGLAVQPDVLRDIARMPGFRGRGLLARILYALPENIVGRRKIGPPPVPDAVAACYAQSLRALVCSLAGWTDPAVLPLTPEAGELILALEAELEPQLTLDAALGYIADWASKWIGSVVRIAGLLHLSAHLCDGWGRPLQPATVTAATRIGRYYLHHAQAVFDLMGADPVVDDARVVLGWIERTQPGRFTRRDAFTGCSRARFRKVGDLDPALDVLMQHGYIRPTPAAEPPGRGRPPSPAYQVNPALHAQEAAAETAKTAEPAGDEGGR